MNNHETFIADNIRKKLLLEGYKSHQIGMAVEAGIRHYHSGKAKTGQIFKECLDHARAYLKRKAA
ncbi:hypothetical protein [Photobacterium sp. 1_MG-2023]|uniref:hypothetical protein n=1 Tax=Photobacterium sp. 1_MG-2023 TaxID=3062646 RepID=UPI0026E181B8|nr:hypothetical protein [Photobacterium sp. 1_MG-2023]MDO6707959.1 hypothetical protein [Photobacterium sp. 1_MG-2023]